MTNRPYIRPIPLSWWLREKRYLRYMAREISCLFIGFHALILLVAVYRLSQGAEAYEAFLANLWSTSGQFLSLTILLMAIIHSVTWFSLTPKAMPIWFRGKPVPGWMIAGAHFCAWFLVSAIVLMLAGGMD